MQTTNNRSPTSSTLPPVKKLMKQLLDFKKDGFPHDLSDTLERVVSKASEHMIQKVVQFLHDDLDDTKHTEDEVKSILEAFPAALTYKDKRGKFPVQAMLTPKKILFLPILAQVGDLHDLCGEGSRGGLLRAVPNRVGFADTSSPVYTHKDNLLQRLSRVECGAGGMDEEKVLLVLEKLKAMGIIHKEDIGKYKLLDPLKQCQFKFFAMWNPEALREVKWKGTDMPYLNAILRTRSPHASKTFENFLKVSMKCFPQELGLLFKKHNKTYAIKDAFKCLGQNKTMEIIKRCMPLSDDYPILHIVHRLAHRYVEIFSVYYPDATYMRDSKNQTLFQSMLASGKKKFANHPSFFLQASDDQLAVKDPVTDLLPFAHAASNDTSDLSAVYILLRRDPTSIWGHGRSTERIVYNKRKREVKEDEASRKQTKTELVAVKKEQVEGLMVFI